MSHLLKKKNYQRINYIFWWYTAEQNKVAIRQSFIIFFSECITPSDCPNGGKDFVCNANKCECQSPKVLDGDKCVGKLHHDIKPTCNFRLDSIRRNMCLLITHNFSFQNAWNLQTVHMEEQILNVMQMCANAQAQMF